MGMIRWCIENDKVQWEYVRNFTNASLLVKDEFGWADGLFTGYDEEKRDYDRTSWDYQIGEDGFALTDPTLQDPRCVWNLLKAHVDVYTPEMVERICGTPKDKFLHIAEMIGECSSPTKTMTSMYALGWTQHSKGAQNIRGMAMLQLILGNIGVRGGGMNALRGHSNIQGLTDVGLMSNLLPGYLNMPTEKEVDFETYMSTRVFKPLRPGQTSYWQNYRKFMVSFMKAMWGDARHGGERLGLRLSAEARRAELRHPADVRADERRQGQPLLLPGLQPAAGLPEPRQGHRGAVEAEAARDDGPARDRDVALLGEPRRLQQRRHAPRSRPR